MSLNQLELQNLRHLIGGHQTTAAKLETYAAQTQNPQLKQMLQQDAQASIQSCQKLLTFLQ
ncbi:spore coat protein CotF [Bacillus ectoiniformans]|uniref:DUF1657 domain-containing protein n=1 Tax=Bacillus ectoiniformans TaxID=1494429 RepID=UPI00195F1C56|nr:DUF1657 domain-containing protein [Bacillus ectoiniformans]MBM7647737.1 spore coat protein CotF [Bacillus ectoiniformans]